MPELAMTMDEGDQFMKSAQNVMRHYSVESSQKTIDWLAFGGTVCMIYGTRFGAYMVRTRSEQKDRPPGKVYQVSSRAPVPPASPAPAPAPDDGAHIGAVPEFDGQE